MVTAPGVPPANTVTVTKPDASVVRATSAVLPCVPNVTPPGLPVNVKLMSSPTSADPVVDSSLNVKVACEVEPEFAKKICVGDAEINATDPVVGALTYIETVLVTPLVVAVTVAAGEP